MPQTQLGSYDEADDSHDSDRSAGDRSARGTDDSPSRRCLSLTVSGPWGHFRHVDGNTIKRTYRIMPRTTVAGMLSAVAGYDRDSYYDRFGPEVSGIAVELIGEIRTMNLPENSLTTSSEGLKTVNSRGKVSITYPDPNADRQRVNYEVLVDPEYRIDVWLDDDEAYHHLKSMLSEGKSYYAPSLGLSEHLAEIEYHGEYDVEPMAVDSEEIVTVESAVPDADGVVPSPETTYGTERSPGYMTKTTGEGEFTGRKTTGFLTYTYSPSGAPLDVKGVEPVEVDGRTVVFV
ncbi:type I-B CRISPR-associated protein Cas5b [Halorussus salilacus]|uniref:type I-B CRISPR-associated protein Cas5b n=1 Tax=Halorussus salilacus TaxID=2953750 RepID=UPI00209F156F|nr:type I-B CRISPR-associated protein Cas5b [Halorussus salilacus]USZ68377.1 type I-B CRISPR-associated protein Cas5b [Halorussus salilacus]